MPTRSLAGPKPPSYSNPSDSQADHSGSSQPRSWHARFDAPTAPISPGSNRSSKTTAKVEYRRGTDTTVVACHFHCPPRRSHRLGFVTRLDSVAAARGSLFDPVRLPVDPEQNTRRISSRQPRMKSMDPKEPIGCDHSCGRFRWDRVIWGGLGSHRQSSLIPG
jgi:hypothetical protein